MAPRPSSGNLARGGAAGIWRGAVRLLLCFLRLDLAGAASFSAVEDVASLSAERRSRLSQFYKAFNNADGMLTKYMRKKAEDPGADAKRMIKRAARRFRVLEESMAAAYRSDNGEFNFEARSERLMYFAVVTKCAKAFEDLHDYPLEASYSERNLELDTCKELSEEGYAMCTGHYYNRLIIAYRHHLNLPHHATFWYEKAIVQEVDGMRIFPWPNEWHIGLESWPGLRSQPYWEGEDQPALAPFLEEHYPTIKAEFLQLIKHPEFRKHWPQDNYYLTREGDWSKLNILEGSSWSRACKVMPQTCELLSARPEVAGPPPSRSWRGSQRNGAALFRLRPGSRLKPHTGPANYRLYCHLGLVVPPGPWLRVGPGVEREWREGGALCFDDSYVHEAWHNGTEDRYVMMVSFWHPDLAK